MANRTSKRANESPLIREDKGLKERPEESPVLGDPVRGYPEQGGEEAGVKEVELRCLDQPFEPVAEPGFEPADEIQLLEHGDIFTHRLIVQPQLNADWREIGQLARVQGEHPKQAREMIELLHRIIYREEGYLLKVPLIGKRNDDEVYRRLRMGKLK